LTPAADRPARTSLGEEAALRALVEGTARETGEDFFLALVRRLAETLETEGAWVTEFDRDAGKLRSLAMWMGGRRVPHYEYDIAGTPCEPVIGQACLAHFPENVIELFPGDPDLAEFNAVSYLGAPLLSHAGEVLGNLAVFDTRPMPEEPRHQALFKILADRAAAELARVRAEESLREREEKLSRLFDGAMDAVLELDENLFVTQVNRAGEAVFGAAHDVLGRPFAECLSEESLDAVCALIEDLADRPAGSRAIWLREGLRGRRAGGETFPAEASFACHEGSDRRFYTVILRDVIERVAAERTIRALTAETEFLREETGSGHGPVRILGESTAIRDVLRDVEQVAATDASVLLLGETGTGKGLVARAVHEQSRRRDGPLVRVNCAAIPAELIESEFFGHEKGAFTGATAKREGRFERADGGTLFLDEVGEIPVGLQAKLLRVLQEGEFERLGGVEIHTVDVRVIAATNLDLEKAVDEGRFRADLYFRLNVFPIVLPPLRRRRGDIPILARAFASRLAAKMGREGVDLSQEAVRRLSGYDWPGNVRELENVIERALITSPADRVVFDRALPTVTSPPTRILDEDSEDAPVFDREAMKVLETRNIERALSRCDGQIAGEGGAARLLGMSPSTLSSRMKSLGIPRP
jgi:PAS domain S-box-containing protein